MLEAVAVEIGKVLCLKLSDQFVVCSLQEHLSNGATRIDIENLLMQLLLYEPLSLLLIDGSLFHETVDDECLLFSLGDLDIEQCIDFVDMIIHGLLVVERMLMQVKLVLFYKLLWALEFAAQKVGEQTRVGHYFVIFDVGVDQKLIQKLLNFVVEVLLVDLLCLMDGNAAFVGFD